MSSEDNDDNFAHLLQHPSFTKGDVPKLSSQNLYRCQDNITRDTFKQALTGAFSKFKVVFEGVIEIEFSNSSKIQHTKIRLQKILLIKILDNS